MQGKLVIIIAVTVSAEPTKALVPGNELVATRMGKGNSFLQTAHATT